MQAVLQINPEKYHFHIQQGNHSVSGPEKKAKKMVHSHGLEPWTQ